MKVMRLSKVVGLMGLVLGLGACATPQAVPPPSTGGAGDSGAATQPSGSAQVKPIDSGALVPKGNVTVEVVFTEGPDKGKHAKLTMDSSGKQWTVAVEKQSTATFEVDRDGAVRLVAEEDFKNDVKVTYDPGLIVLPAKIEGGASGDSKAKTLVVGRQTGDSRASGETTSKIAAVWQTDVSTAAGDFPGAYAVRQERHMKLDVAEVQLTIDTFYVPAKGIVAESVWKSEKTLGLFGSNTHTHFERTDK